MKVYEKDETRDADVNLIKALKGKDKIPCFFLPDENGEPKFIGHTGVFRFPYDKSLADALPSNSGIDPITIVERLFGYQNNKGGEAGRIFFEDAYGTNETSKEFGALKILSSPKPTTYQHYLKQKGPYASNHWGGANAEIRGTKVYWHRTAADWRNEDINIIAETQQELIKKCLEYKNEQFTVGEIVKSGALFSGRIRFENLTNVEVGLLLLSLDLPNGCAHKIGMGKPLGLGSISLITTLHIFDRKKRYSNIFDNAGNWSEANNQNNDLKQDMQNTCMQAIAGEEITTKTFWELNWLKELKAILTLKPAQDNKTWSEEYTRYMEIEFGKDEVKHIKGDNEYSERPILPSPIEVIGFSRAKK